MRRMLVCLLALASVAHADGKLPVSADGKRITLPNNVVLEAKGRLWATRGKLTVAIDATGGGNGFEGITSATLDHGTVAVSYTDFCEATTYTLKLTLERETIAPFVAWAAMLPTQKLMLFSWWREQPEAECGSPPPYTGLDVIPIVP